MQRRSETDTRPDSVAACGCHVAACHASTGVEALVGGELERVEARVDARLRRLAIEERLRSIGRPAAATGAVALMLVLVLVLT